MMMNGTAAIYWIEYLQPLEAADATIWNRLYSSMKRFSLTWQV